MSQVEKTNTLEERNASQKATILSQVTKLKKANERIADLEIWERFVGYLIHNCELKVITEESLQGWLAEMLESEKGTKK